MNDKNKILLKIDKYEKHLFNFINKYEKIFKKIISGIDFVVIKIINFLKYIFYYTSNAIEKLGKIMRYTTFPFHWIWIKIDLKKLEKNNILELRIFEVGAHYIYGKPGAGKSTCIYHAMMDYAYTTGKTSYTTEAMETPRKDLYGREYYYHQTFEPSEFFQDGEQIVSFNSDRHNVIVYEEMLGKYHQRNNNQKSYNNEVLPMIAAIGTQRHQSIDLFYFISQLPKNDISLMQILSWYHEPRIKKAFDYKTWLATGKISFYIKGWYIKSYKVVPKGASDYALTNEIKWFYPCIYQEDMEYFNRLNMQEKYNKLPKHKGGKMYA